MGPPSALNVVGPSVEVEVTDAPQEVPIPRDDLGGQPLGLLLTSPDRFRFHPGVKGKAPASRSAMVYWPGDTPLRIQVGGTSVIYLAAAQSARVVLTPVN